MEGLQFQAVGFAFPGGDLLVDGLDLALEPGTITAIVGASGCGKSTLLRLAAGLLAPSAGAVRRPEGPRAFVFQAPTLLAWRSLEANVGLPLELAGVAAAERRARVGEVLAEVGLSEAAAQLPRALSGGMKMRASLARALVTRPSLLLMDEPFSALDALSRRAAWALFLERWSATRCTTLLVTHDTDEAVLLAHRVVAVGGKPLRVQADLAVELPWPRGPELRHDPRLAVQSAQVEAAL